MRHLPVTAKNVQCGPKHLNITLTRTKLEQLVADLIDETEEPCRQALAGAGLKTADVDEVILVGGSPVCLPSSGR